MLRSFKWAFNCSMSKTETLGQGVKYVQSQQYRHQNDVVLVNLEHISHFFSEVSVVDYEQLIAG